MKLLTPVLIVALLLAGAIWVLFAGQVINKDSICESATFYELNNTVISMLCIAFFFSLPFIICR